MSHKHVELHKTVKKGWNQVSPKGHARLGFFQTTNGRENADNVFVLVAHYDFKEGKDDWPRKGNDKDVENLRKTFAENRKCRFRDLPSPKKEDLLALLADEKKLKKFFASEDVEPSMFIFIILSHGGPKGKIYTDEIISNVYDSFNTKELFAKLEKTCAKCLRLLFLGPCRGELSFGDTNQADSQDTAKNYSSNVSFEPKMHNTIIFYSTVETTTADRDPRKGTWLVQCLCEQLNLMRANESLAHFSTGMQNRIHEWAIKAQPDIRTQKQTEQTMEIKMFPHDRKFFFSAFENCGQSQSTIEFDWMNPNTKSVFRGKLAVIFHQGNEIKKLEYSLIENLGFETKTINSDLESVEKYFAELKEKSWSDYGCFAAFFFAQVTEEENQVCVNLSGNEPVPIGDLIHSLLGPESQEWQGKPKLFFLIDVGRATEDAQGKPSSQPIIEFLPATPHSGWMLFILRMIANFQRNGSYDILSNPLHLKMIAQTEDSFSGKDSQNLFHIYEKIVQKKMREALAVDYTEGNMMYEEALEKCEKELQTISLSYLNNESVEDLKYTRNGIVTLVEGNIVFVHQTFAEFLAAQNYIECLNGEKFKKFEMPIDLLEEKYRQVRKFVDMKISREKDEETAILKSSLELFFMEKITKEMIAEILVSENLPTMFSLYENQISFGKNRSKAKFHFENGYQILKEACWKNEEIALNILNHGAFESLEFSKINEITKILCGAVKNNFLKLFAALVEKCSTHGLIEKCQANHDNDMSFAVTNASEKNHHEMLKLVIESGLIDMHGLVKSNALVFAVSTNSVECVELLIQHGFPTACVDFLFLYEFSNFEYYNYYMEEKTIRALLGTKSEPPEKLAIRLFQYAIKIGNVEAAKFLQQEYRGIEKTVFDDGRTALHVAAEIRASKKHSAALEICRWLVQECDFKIGDKDYKGRNALHIGKGNLELAKYFLEKDPALIKSVDDDHGLNLLQFACYWSEGKKIVEFFHSRDGDLIKQEMKEGKTALHLAAEKENLELCVFLVENGVDLNAVDDKGWNAAHCAAVNKRNKEGGKILQYLHKEKPELIKQKTILGETMLHIACKNRLNEETIEWLMAQGLDPSDVNRKGWNALHFAASGGKIGKIEFIHGKFPGLMESLTNDAENAMHLMAASYSEKDELKELHALCGKLVKQKTKTNKTVLHYAAQSGWCSEEKCEWLVEEIGLEIESEDNDGWKFVHFAASEGKIGVIKFILKKCPHLIESLTNDGENAMHLMAKRYCVLSKLKELHALCGKLVKQKTKANKTVLHYAAQSHLHCKEKCKWLVEEIGLPIEAEDDDGWNVVHFVANNYNRYEILELLEYIKTKNSRLIVKTTQRNETALHTAAMKGNSQAFEWLLKNCVDPELTDVDGKTALQVARPQDFEDLKRILAKLPPHPNDQSRNTLQR
ncbi:uncharacterized protein LOC132196030 [Neocloeon triangulifer]|uniref:uncharacterized protein LOC132196030 n=1 Tax=Neocloeon triangulifer TaxID=2078957 RepID=UPI00286F226F|nr:uncharacterized protein LOC132196030 [Neocloeon triangulifer]